MWNNAHGNTTVNHLITLLTQANLIPTNHMVPGSQISHLVALAPAYLYRSLGMCYNAAFRVIGLEPGRAETWLRLLKEGRMTRSQILPHCFSRREHYTTSDTVINSTLCGGPRSVYLTNWVLWFALACCCLPCTHPHMWGHAGCKGALCDSRLLSIYLSLSTLSTV